MELDGGHLGREDAGGAVQRGEGLVEHGHVPADRRLALDEDHLLAGVGQGQGGLDPGDAAADDHRPGDDPHELPLQRLVAGDAADGRGQVGLRFVQGVGLVLRDPRHLLADVAHLHQEAVQAGVLGGAAEGGLVQVRRAGGHHDAGEAVLGDVPLHQFLAGVRAHVLVVPGEDHAGQPLGELASTPPRPPCRQCCCRNGKRKPRSAAIHRRSCRWAPILPSRFPWLRKPTRPGRPRGAGLRRRPS